MSSHAVKCVESDHNMTFCNTLKVKVTTVTCLKPPDWLPLYAILFGLSIRISWFANTCLKDKSLPPLYLQRYIQSDPALTDQRKWSVKAGLSVIFAVVYYINPKSVSTKNSRMQCEKLSKLVRYCGVQLYTYLCCLAPNVYKFPGYCSKDLCLQNQTH